MQEVEVEVAVEVAVEVEDEVEDELEDEVKDAVEDVAVDAAEETDKLAVCCETLRATKTVCEVYNEDSSTGRC